MRTVKISFSSFVLRVNSKIPCVNLVSRDFKFCSVTKVWVWPTQVRMASQFSVILFFISFYTTITSNKVTLLTPSSVFQKKRLTESSVYIIFSFFTLTLTNPLFIVSWLIGRVICGTKRISTCTSIFLKTMI